MENDNLNETISVGKSLFDKQKLYLPVAIMIAAVLISGSIVYTKSGSNQNLKGVVAQPSSQKVDVSIDDDPFLGLASAPVKVIEFSDFQCPFCRAFWSNALPSIKKDYIDTGKVQFVYRDFPLSFHPASVVSALATDCANEQGKYWEMNNKIFSEQEKQGTGTITYGVSELKKWAKDIGLNVSQFNQCLDSQKYKSEVDKDTADGTKAGVSGTPTLYINGQQIVGAQPYSAFQAAIEVALKDASKGAKSNGFFK